MALGINDLVNNITDSVQNLVNQLTGQTNNQYPYPTQASMVGTALNSINKKAWNSLPTPYSFAVYNGNIGSFDGTPFKEFQLPLAPGKINQTEHFAISIKPTQGGTVVSHSGNKYKTLLISGTTGVAPFRGAGGVVKATGEAIAAPNDLKHKSGYEVFQQLRNYFKAYYEYKRLLKDPSVQAVRLVFKNYKDGEFLIVELLDFQMDRQGPRSFLYDYNLTFKVIGKVTFQAPNSNLTAFENVLATASSYIDLARGTFLQAQSILRQVEATYDATILNPLRQAALAVKAFQGIGATAAEVSHQIISDTTTALAALGILKKFQAIQTAQSTGSAQASASSGPSNVNANQVTLPTDLAAATSNNPAQSVINLNQGLLLLAPTDFPPATQAAFALDQAASLNLPRSFYQTTLDNLQRVKDNAEDAFGLSCPAYDALFDRTSTVPASTVTSTSITDAQFDVLAAFTQAIQGIQSIMATDAMFKSTFADQIAYMNNAFADQIDLQALPAVQQVIMPANTDLERLAQTYLNDPTRWVEIAELNDLRSPFLIQDQSDTTSNVIHPGQPILIPVNPTVGFSTLPVGAEITSEQLTQFEKSLGTDFKLTSNFDLSLGSDQDLQIISGTQNVAQAVVLKLGIEQGELISNPTIGVGIQVGGVIPDLNQVRDDLIKTLTQDNRIAGVNNLTIYQKNSALWMTFQLFIKQLDIPVPLDIKL
jgi:hypothetical protein